ncbi:MAG: phosphohydrolase [Acidobacteria bacterium]|nr:phosphohydrolase [Acidobacteriota bacterium]
MFATETIAGSIFRIRQSDSRGSQTKEILIPVRATDQAALLHHHLTLTRRARDNAATMASKRTSTFVSIESRFPGLLEKVRQVFRDTENAYEGGDNPESFLWEHTMHVASIADQLARAEGLHPQIPVIAALFHDAGKFADGKYHRDGTIEEEESARIAGPLLREFGMKPADITRVLSGVKALYNEQSRKNRIGAILHDADFLSKFGAMGVASFFTKATLRGRTLRSAVIGYLSKELTYAACLPLNMHTAAGKKLATRKARDSVKFFRSLLDELREARIAALEVRPIRIPYPSRANKSLTVQLVVSPACPECGGDWDMGWSTEKGVKCEKLNMDWRCSHCGKQLETSFCLPEIV